MANTLTIVHAPGTNSIQTQVLEKKLESVMKELNIGQENILINRDAEIDLEAIEKSENPRTLIIRVGTLHRTMLDAMDLRIKNLNDNQAVHCH